jgi:hypothetical protein
MTGLGQLNDLETVVLSTLTAAIEAHGRPVSALEVYVASDELRPHGLVAVGEALKQLEHLGRVVRHPQPRSVLRFPGPRPDLWSLADRSET